jgi:hypothetical protein
VKERTKRGTRLRRTIAVLALGIAIGTMMVATPAGAHVGGTVGHLWNDHIKPKADARYLQNTKTLIVSDTVTDGNFDVSTVTCPAGWQAVGGGVDPSNVFTMQVTASGPLVNGTRMLSTADGTHGPANGWWGGVVNNSGGNASYKVGVICAK